MTLQSIPPPPCLCQHGAEWHSRNYHVYPTGIWVSS